MNDFEIKWNNGFVANKNLEFIVSFFLLSIHTVGLNIYDVKKGDIYKTIRT